MYGLIYISPHITVKEAIHSDIAKIHKLENIPPLEILNVMQITAEKLFEPARRRYGRPIFINSFFRSPQVNRLAGGAKTSQHLKGEALDLDAQPYGGSNLELFNILKEQEFDQLITYGPKPYDFIHVSYTERRENRRQVLHL